MTSTTFLDGRVTMLLGDVRAMLKTLPDDHFDCVVTSPPYWGLRDYGTGRWEGGDIDCAHQRIGADRTPWANSVKGPGNVGKNGSTYANMTKDGRALREVRRCLCRLPDRDGIVSLGASDRHGRCVPRGAAHAETNRCLLDKLW